MRRRRNRTVSHTFQTCSAVLEQAQSQDKKCDADAPINLINSLSLSVTHTLA